MNGTRTIGSPSHCAGLTLSCDDQRPTCIIKLKEMGASGMLRTVSILEDGADCQIRWAIRGKGGKRLERLQDDGCARGDLAGVQHTRTP